MLQPILLDGHRQGAARIVVTYRNEQPLDLLEFTASLTALAREYEHQIHKSRPDLPIAETKLIVVDIRRGSTIIELIPDFLNMAGVMMAPMIEYTNTAVTFVENISKVIKALTPIGGRAPDQSPQALKHLSDMVQAVASENRGNFILAASHSNGTEITSIAIKSDEARNIITNASDQRKEIEDRHGDRHNKVVMRLHQTSVADLVVGKKTTERGIIERIDENPKPLIYVSDLSGQKIKDEITKPDANPYQKAFVVDVDVETIGGKPRFYRILNVHDVLDIDDEDPPTTQ